MANAGVPESTYTPLYARAVQVPRPWGVTALFAEHTGTHAPLDIDWEAERKAGSSFEPPRPESGDRAGPPQLNRNRPLLAVARLALDERTELTETATISRVSEPSARSFRLPRSGILAGAINRSDRAALEFARSDAADGIPIEAVEVRKLLGTVWFRGVVPQLSEQGRQRVLDVLVSSMPIRDHVLRVDHRDCASAS